MNERIRELAEQANARKLDWAYYRGEKKPGTAVDLHSVDLELFAELLIRECADIAYKTSWDALVHEYGQSVIPLHLYNTIKQRYGVEE